MIVTATIAGLSLLGSAVAAVQLRPKARARRRAKRAVKRVRAEQRALERVQATAARSLTRSAGRYAQFSKEERLASVPVEELRSFGAEKVRWGVLEEAGIENAADLRGLGRHALEALDGIGDISAKRILKARKKLYRANEQEPAPLPSVGRGEPEVVELLQATRDSLTTRDALVEVAPLLTSELDALRERLRDVRRRAALFFGVLGGADSPEAVPVIEAADRIVQDVEQMVAEGGIVARSARARGALGEEVATQLDPEELARDHERRYADYCSMIDTALVEAAPKRKGSILAGPSEGGLPDEIARHVQSLQLMPAGLRLTLRGYQEFGAKYLLVQERTLLGDEMGLGKTVQTLAALCHLKGAGEGTHFLVVSPASILFNWIKETSSRTGLAAHLLHGDERDEALERWRSTGGVAVTSFGTLGVLGIHENEGPIDFLVVDEAHYVKNPEANRTRTIAQIAAGARRVAFLTGTPIENRLVEFRNLVSQLQEPVAYKLGEAPAATEDLSIGRRAFGEIVAPVYLRRNQTDVLRELPPRIDKEEWVELSATDVSAYREAVEGRDIMAMRRTATLGSENSISAKMERLAELLEEHFESGSKVLLFTFFLDVLDAVEAAHPVFGRIAGSVAAAERGRIVEAFTESEGPQLLIAQITAGGVGLNIQAASVVVLMEPQWKPSSEEQAIARAHRMGQSRPVIVHRLYAKDSVDERMLEALGEKRELFDSFARGSRVKDASPEATETALVQQVIDAEAARLGVGV